MFHSLYRGFTIWRNTAPGFALRWTAKHDNGDKFAADTLAGLRQLIRGA
jgi:hypothetical protein